ncbi:hypothetical protein H4S01_005483, partial [Coemansia sp. RSA 2610]
MEDKSSESFASESNLALQSPPPMLVQSPRVDAGQFAETRTSMSMKRTRADIATPQRPGTVEARTQQDMEFINTPARAPSAMKRQMRSGSPVSRTDAGNSPFLAGPDNDDSADAAMADNADAMPPKFLLAGSHPDLSTAPSAPANDEAVFGSPKPASPHTELKREAQAAEIVSAVDAVEIISSGPIHSTDIAMVGEPTQPADTLAVEESVHLADTTMVEDPAQIADITMIEDVQPEVVVADTEAAPAAPVECPAEVDMSMMVVDASETALVSVDQVSPETVMAAALKVAVPEVDPIPAAPTASGAQTPAGRPHFTMTRGERAELTTARIFDDPDLMQAASVPLPGTPSLRNQSVTPARTGSKHDDSEFYIPADWLMDPSTAKRNGRPTDAPDTPLKQYSSPSGNGQSLIPVTPANQKLLDSLEIQWVSPRQVPKFSQADVDAIRAEHADQTKRDGELRDKVLQALKDEYAENMRKQEDKAEQLLKEAEDMFQAHLEHQEREFAKRLEAEEQRHQSEIARRDEDQRTQAEELGREIDNAISERTVIVAERDELRTMLDDYVATSSKLLEEREGQILGLTRELGKSSLERQNRDERILELQARVEELDEEKNEALVRMEAVTTENVQLEQLTSALRNDVLVAEERCTKIKEHATATLDKANTTIGSLTAERDQASHEATTFKSQAAKAEARLRSLTIQLESMK